MCCWCNDVVIVGAVGVGGVADVGGGGVGGVVMVCGGVVVGGACGRLW